MQRLEKEQKKQENNLMKSNLGDSLFDSALIYQKSIEEAPIKEEQSDTEKALLEKLKDKEDDVKELHKVVEE